MYQELQKLRMTEVLIKLKIAEKIREWEKSEIEILRIKDGERTDNTVLLYR